MYLTRFGKEARFIKDWEKNKDYYFDKNEKYELSKTGRNVIVICLDRFLGCFLPFILSEKPQLKNIYSGFVFYPNTVSFHGSTVLNNNIPIKIRIFKNFSKESPEIILIILLLSKHKSISIVPKLEPKFR